MHFYIGATRATTVLQTRVYYTEFISMCTMAGIVRIRSNNRMLTNRMLNNRLTNNRLPYNRLPNTSVVLVPNNTAAVQYQIQPSVRMRVPTRDGTTEPVPRGHIFRRERVGEKNSFPVQLPKSRVGNPGKLTLLMPIHVTNNIYSIHHFGNMKRRATVLLV